MAMAEGERAECPESPQDEPPADGALKRAEELKTQANDYFKGAPALEAAKGEVESCPGRGARGPRGTMATRSGSLRPGPALPSDRACGGPWGPRMALPGGDRAGFREERWYLKVADGADAANDGD